MRKSAPFSVIEKLEDHARVCDTIDAICCAIENGTDMPNYIPVCNDLMLTDQLTKIAECIMKSEKKS